MRLVRRVAVLAAFVIVLSGAAAFHEVQTTRDMDDDFPDNDRDSEPAPPPMIMEAQQPAAAANAGGMTANMAPPAVVAKFEKDDLDVPAFLRKRNDVM